MALTLPPDFKEFLKLLKEHDVLYLLIGGYKEEQESKREDKGYGRSRAIAIKAWKKRPVRILV